MAYTMREVAKRAGVSPATVSRVLNKTDSISPDTTQRVLEVVSLLQYHKNVHARRLSTGQSNLFGLVISEITNPYFPELIKGFQAAAWDRGFDVLLCNTEYSEERTTSVIRRLIESDVRGIAVMTASVDRNRTADLTAAGIAVVFSDLGPARTLVSNVSVNYRRGISQAVIGVDDISFAFLTRPPLTTIRVPREQVGRTAFEALDKILRLKRRRGAEYHLETELIIRRSTAPAR